MAKNQSNAVFTRVSTCTIAVGATLALFLSACGGDSGSNGPGDNVTSESDIIEATFDDLPVCSDKREGATAYVKNEKTAYVCSNGDWVVDGDEFSTSSSYCEDCKDDTISSSSNGKTTSSSSAKDQGSSSSSTDNAKSPSSVKNESSSSRCKDCKDEILSSSSLINEQYSSTSEQPDVIAIKDKSISGVSQKGPFVTGSAVKLYELDGMTYAQTGKSFTGKITTDDGKFSVSSVTLASQYALLEANGYFRNEITGKKSSGTVTLNALTDLTDRKTVNINLLTHLEYERALYLVGTGINVPSAKKQAEAEILNAFGIKGEFANSEDLDIFSKGDGNAALLAFSVLMLRNLSEADLTELLTKFATDIEKDGSWDDEESKAEVANWAQEKDLGGELTSIRSNVEKWNLGTVPEFEKYVRNFWYINYGLGECGANNKAEVLVSKNELSTKYGTQTRYICKDGMWVEATDIEKDFYNSGKDNADDGELWKGLVTGKMYKYDETQKMWLVANHNDTTLKLMGCTTNRAGEISKSSVDDTYYECVNMEWLESQEIDYDTYGERCSSGDVGKTVCGVVTASNKYYCSANGWVSLTSGWSWEVPKEARLNPEIAYGTMIDARDNKVYKTVKIGTQVWMAENLNYGTMNARNEVIGRLYSYGDAVGRTRQECDENSCNLEDGIIQGICPEGWHLPTNSDWNTLFDNVGGISMAGRVLKSQTGWNDSGNGMDSEGFSALPAGEGLDDDGSSIGKYAYFWSSTEYGPYDAYKVILYSSRDAARLTESGKEYGYYSVRCLLD